MITLENMKVSNNTLEQKTQAYWVMSRAWRGRAHALDRKYNIGEAIAECNFIRETTYYKRTVLKHINTLLTEVIREEPIDRKQAEVRQGTEL